jgi:hypothetical protein
VFSFGQRVGAVTAIVALSTVGLGTVALPVMAAGAVVPSSLTLDQDRAQVLAYINARQNRLIGLDTSLKRTGFISSSRRDAIELVLADGVAKLGVLLMDVSSATTVDQVEADRAKMTALRVIQVVSPRTVFVLRGSRMAERLAASATSLRAAKGRTNHTADVALERAARQCDAAASNLVAAVTAAYRVAPRSAVDGATPFTDANAKWATAITAIAKARTYLDAAQKADRAAPADTVIRPAEDKPVTPIFDRA